MIVLTLFIAAWIDYITGVEFSFALFYLSPIFIAAWYDNKYITIVIVLVSVLTWLYVDIISGHRYSNILVRYWNTFARLILFGIVAILIVKVRASLTLMTHMAMQDSLTLLNNSRGFEFEYEKIKKEASKQHSNIAIGLIDLDGFKQVNDTLGHRKGDDVLIQFSSILKRSVRKRDIVSRIGGDEFVVLLIDVDANGIEEYCKRLRSIFDSSGLADQFGINFSMGVQLFKQMPDSLDDATHQADQLMYASKLQGKSRTTIQYS